MNNYGKFGALLGTIFIGNTHCKFLIYAVKNAEVLTCHEVIIHQISQKAGWIEFDPLEIWRCVVECINVGTKNLVILGINPADIIALGVTNQRETTVLWHRINGMPIYNAIAWNDTRTSSTVNAILAQIRNKKNILKSVCGLPLSNCFSAVKIKWICEHVPEVNEIIAENNCLFGTLDTWILWNLTGGIEGGVHVTDVTNASRTMLMNLTTLKWDAKLCAFFRISPKILPEIKSCSEVYGFVHDGPLQGIPIAGCLGEQPASLLGQMCIKNNQATCTYEDSCFLFMNTGQEIIDSDNGLLATLAFQLGPKAKPYYALEGAVANAGTAISWLKENLSVNTELPTTTTMTTPNNSLVIPTSYYGGDAATAAVLSAYNNNLNGASGINGGVGGGSCGNDDNMEENILPTTTDVVFVPAFSGLYSPFWKHNSRGIILGLNPHTTARQITIAAYEAICFQTRDLLESLTKDLSQWPKLEKLIVGGEFSEKPFLLQLLADICGITIERPQTSSPSCLGAMLAAGSAMNVLKLDNCINLFSPPSDIFQPAMSSKYRDAKYRRWKSAIRQCLNWDSHSNLNMELSTFDDQDPETLVRCSIPGSIFIFSSLALLFITNFLKKV